MTTFTFATSGVHTPILLSAHAAYSASRTLVNAGIDQVVPLVVQRPDTPTQHDITALFPSYAAADAFATALRSEGLCAVSIADALRTNLATYWRTPAGVDPGQPGTESVVETGGPVGMGWWQFVSSGPDSGSPFLTDYSAGGTGALPVIAGETYTVSAYVRQDSADDGTPFMRIGGNWYDGAGTPVSSTASDILSTVEGEFVRISRVITAPAGIAFFKPVVAFSGSDVRPAGTVYYVVGVMLERGAHLGDYFNGSYSPSPAFDAAWTGPADASTSVLVPKGVQVAQFDGISSSQVRVQNTPGTGATEVQFTLTEVPA